MKVNIREFDYYYEDTEVELTEEMFDTLKEVYLEFRRDLARQGRQQRYRKDLPLDEVENTCISHGVKRMEQQVEHNMFISRLTAFLKTLPAIQRQRGELYFLEMWSIIDIAAYENVHRTAVIRSIQKIAMKALKMNIL